MNETIKHEFEKHIQIASELHQLTDLIAGSAKLCITCLKNGGKIILFGNGGSASDAQHIAAELVGRYKIERKGLGAIALNTDTSSITSIGNDFGYDKIFHRQLESLASPGDVVIGISTSGSSKNVLLAIDLAEKLKCKTIGLTGKAKNKLNEICDITLNIPSTDTPRIQEMHILLGHILCNLIDQAFTE